MMFAGSAARGISRTCKVLILALLVSLTTGLNGLHPMAECSGSIPTRGQDGFSESRETRGPEPDRHPVGVVPSVRAEISRRRKLMVLRPMRRAATVDSRERLMKIFVVDPHRSVARRRRSLTDLRQDITDHPKAIMDHRRDITDRRKAITARHRDLMGRRSAIRTLSIAEVRRKVKVYRAADLSVRLNARPRPFHVAASGMFHVGGLQTTHNNAAAAASGSDNHAHSRS